MTLWVKHVSGYCTFSAPVERTRMRFSRRFLMCVCLFVLGSHRMPNVENKSQFMLIFVYGSQLGLPLVSNSTNSSRRRTIRKPDGQTGLDDIHDGEDKLILIIILLQ